MDKQTLPSITLNELPEPTAPRQKKSHKLHRKYLINILFVLAVTSVVLYLNLKGNVSSIAEALKSANPFIIGGAILLQVVVLGIDGLIFFVLARLYTARYNYRKAFSNAMVGAFYNNITPGHGGGEFAQAYTFNKQGLDLSNAASVIVMFALVRQFALVTWGLLAVIVKLKQFTTIIQPIEVYGLSFPAIWLAIIGFLLNILYVFLIFLLSYSKVVLNTIVGGGIKLLGKLKLIRNPEKVIDNLTVQIENFRIELKRLFSNIPALATLFFLFMLRYLVSYMIPYVVGLAFSTIEMQGNLWDGVFMTAYLYVTTNLFPTPGSSGFSEYFFSHLFQNIFGSYVNTLAPQMIWRAITFYLTLIISGFASAFNKDAPQEDNFKSDRRTFVDLQRSTLAIRKSSSDKTWETVKDKRSELGKKIKAVTGTIFTHKNKKK